MRSIFQNIVKSNTFSFTIFSVIILNAILVGVELSNDNDWVLRLQEACIIVFLVEIAIRWLGRESIESYVKDGWNWFDIIIILISIMPYLFPKLLHLESAHGPGSKYYLLSSTFRIMRVFRVLRLLKIYPNLGIMARVLVKSMSSIFQAILFLLIFMYLYALLGVVLFEGEISVTNHLGKKLDPFGSIFEAFFSLFRVTTGEDWTDLRYDLLNSSWPNSIVNFYFISWMVLSAFLLLNIIIGAIVTHYEKEADKLNKDKRDDQIERMLRKLEAIEQQLNLEKTGRIN